MSSKLQQTAESPMKNHREMRKEDLKEGCGGIFREKPKEKLKKVAVSLVGGKAHGARVSKSAVET
ncbi:hypothetical protein Csa_015208 [Cucumis sativus]|uniref:Uncharacterized protein n=1 Tax=Cucumis sativus TaxID=3659 RepID=A0A0A0KWF5_CUCSA|nr:hypothetical protein Csa_015208 [Cucumis sativus]